MGDAAVHRSFPRSMQQVHTWIWFALHVYVILCLAGVGDLSPLKPLAALCALQFVSAPGLLIYALATRSEPTRNVRFVAVGSVLLVLGAATIYLTRPASPTNEFDHAILWVLFAGILSPFVIVTGLLIWNVFATLALLKAKKMFHAAVVFLVSLALAGLTFSPKEWMWREMPWGLYYAAGDRLEVRGAAGNSSTSIRQIRSVFDVMASFGMGGSEASCSTELYYVRNYSSLQDLSLQLAKLMNFPPRDQFDPPLSVVQHAENIAPGYVLAYDCY
jgi:hypothetical protein